MDAVRAEEVRRGMIVVAGSALPGPRAADRNILDIAGQGGVYRPSEHLERTRSAIDRIAGDPEAFVRSHVRRLEALRRAGHVERIDVDHWRVPADLLDRGQAYDLARDRANIRISILSPTGLDSQIGHDGATWLDRELASPSRTTLANIRMAPVWPHGDKQVTTLGTLTAPTPVSCRNSIRCHQHRA
jgi:hypothetical protein